MNLKMVWTLSQLISMYFGVTTYFRSRRSTDYWSCYRGDLGLGACIPVGHLWHHLLCRCYDAGAIWASNRNKAKWMGSLTGDVVSKRAQTLFMIVICAAHGQRGICHGYLWPLGEISKLCYSCLGRNFRCVNHRSDYFP